MSRLFFGLWPDSTTREKTNDVSLQLSLNSGRQVSADNLHMTLVFLGNVENDVREKLIKSVDSIQGHKFQLVINKVGWWKRPKVIWLGPESTPDALIELQSLIRSLAVDCGLSIDDRPYQPHLTIARKAMKPSERFEFEPICWNISDFCLVESQTLATGAEYKVVQSWPLCLG